MTAPRLVVPVLALVLALVVAAASAAHARTLKNGRSVRSGDWVRLAKVRLGLLEKHETLDVKTDRAVRKVRLHVANVGVVVKDVSIHFEDGDAKRTALFAGYVAAGGQTRALDLDGQTRVIDEVRIAAETRARTLGTAEIELWGLP